MAALEFSIADGIKCNGCKKALEEQGRKQFGESFEITNYDRLQKSLNLLVSDPHDASDIIPFLQSRGYSGIVLLNDKSHKKELEIEAANQKALRHKWGMGIFGIVSGALILALSFTSMFASFPVMVGIAGFSTITTLMLGAESYRLAFESFKNSGKLTMHSLFTLSSLTLLLSSLASFFVPTLPMMFEAGLLIFGFRKLGQAIEDTLQQSIGCQTFCERLPRKINLIKTDGTKKRVSLRKIMDGNTVMIEPGAVIPFDGQCVDDVYLIQTILSGSTKAIPFKKGSNVLAGMQVPVDSTPIQIKVSGNVHTSYLARLDQALDEAKSQEEKAPIEKFADKASHYFVPTVLLAAFISGILVSIFATPVIALKCVAAVLASACPCTLGMITPLAVKIGMNKAAQQGMIFKSASALEELEGVDVFIFDLNGTLTLGKPQVIDCKTHALPDESFHDFYAVLAHLEASSEHSVARAIKTYIARERQTLEDKAYSIEIKPPLRSGVSAIIDGIEYVVGSRECMHENGVKLGDKNPARMPGDSVVYLARNQQLWGTMILRDPLRDQAKQVIATLKNRNKAVYICTGADEETAWRYAEELGLSKTRVFANCYASKEQLEHEIGDISSTKYRDKCSIIEDFKKKGLRVAMVGDAGNDALAVAHSDFGIAVVSESRDLTTTGHAKALVYHDAIKPVVSALNVAKETVYHIKQNLLLSLGYNVLSLCLSGGALLSLGIAVSPPVGAALMILQSALLLGNAYRIKHRPLPEMDEMDEMNEVVCGSYSQVTKIMEPARRSQNFGKESVFQKEVEQRQKTGLFPEVAQNGVNQSLNVSDNRPLA